MESPYYGTSGVLPLYSWRHKSEQRTKPLNTCLSASVRPWDSKTRPSAQRYYWIWQCILWRHYIDQKTGCGAEKAKVLRHFHWRSAAIPSISKYRWLRKLSKHVRKFAQLTFAEGGVIRSDSYRSYVPTLEGYTHQHRLYNPSFS